MSGGLAHSACEDNLHYWKMRIVDYLKRTRECCISNAVAWPAEDTKTAELLIDTTYSPTAASGAPLHEKALHPPWSLSPCVSRSLISYGNYLLFLSAPFHCCYLTHIPSLLKSHPSLVILNSQTPMPFYVCFFLYEDVHTKYSLLLCRWQSWNVLDPHKRQVWHSNPGFLTLQDCPHLFTDFTVL